MTCLVMNPRRASYGNILKVVARGQYVIVILGKFRKTRRIIWSWKNAEPAGVFDLEFFLIVLMVVQNEYEYG